MTFLTILFKKHGIAHNLKPLEIISEIPALTVLKGTVALAVALSVPKLYYVTLKRCPRTPLFFLSKKRKDETIMEEEMKKEAITRMKLLKLHPNIIKEFSNKGILNLSLNAALHYLNEEELARVQEFEQEYGGLVYHVIQNRQMLSFLYVSKHQEEWEFDRSDLKEGCPIAYVANLTDESCSEFGSIGIKSCGGGVLRIY